MQLICFIAFFFVLPASLAALTNVTLDDAPGDNLTSGLIEYLPKDAWKAGPTCKHCVANLDTNQVHDGTWHEGVFDPNREGNEASSPLEVSISFYGMAIYVYGVFANTPHHSNGNLDLTFFVDHQRSGTIMREPTNNVTSPFEYGVLLFAVDSLPQEYHTLTIVNGRPNGPKSLLVLDYIIYSHDPDLPVARGMPPTSRSPSSTAAIPSPTPSTSPLPSKTGGIIGGVLGSIACVLLILVVFLFRRQQKFRKTHGLPAPTNNSNQTLRKEHVHRWFQKISFRKPPPSSHFSFNPSLLVLPIRDRGWNQTRVSVPQIPPRRAKPDAYHSHHEHRPQDPVLLIPIPPPTTNRLSPSILDTHTHLAATTGTPLSINEWREQTQQEADAIPPRLDVSEADLSSYYESDSFYSPPPDRPPPKPTMRRFAVVNN